MKQKASIFRRFPALLMSLILIFSALPISAYAASITVNPPSKYQELQPDFETLREEDSSSPVLREEVKFRDEFTKHYIDPDGNRYAVIFPEQIHYLEQDSWVEVDNTLVFNETAKKYVSENPKFKTQFAQSSGVGKLVSIDDGDYTLSWSISFNSAPTRSKLSSQTSSLISDVKAEVSKISADSIGQERNKYTVSELGKAMSDIKYSGVFNGNIDLHYSVLHGKVEEDVILNSSKDFTSYTLTLDTDGLSAVKSSDNSVAFLTPEGEEIFKIAAPWMKDAAGEVSDGINVSVTVENGVTLITYTPSATWLNDPSRVYPVLIDPSVTSRIHKNNFEDTYVYEGDSASATRPTETTLKVGNISGKKYYAYLKIKSFPELVGCSYIEEATLRLCTNSTTSPALSIFEVNGSWSPTTITYANQPSASSLRTGVTGTSYSGYSVYDINITSWANSIYEDYGDLSDYFEDSDWNGFKIGCTSNSSGVSADIYSGESSTAARRPALIVRYTYTPYPALEDGAIYSFKNKASEKYLTIDAENIDDEEYNANVYQYTKNNSRAQAFRLEYNSSSNAFKIREILTSEYSGSPIGTSIVDIFATYIVGNVEECSDTGIYAKTDWIIEPYGIDTFRIVIAADPSLALTSCGTGNGSQDGTSNTSAGNIFLSEFTGAANQLWKLESGGVQVSNGYNICEEDYGTTYTLSVGATWLSFCCPVQSFGKTVSWSSSNSYVATVDDCGKVTAKMAGEATITATVSYGDNSNSYSCTVYVELVDGIYWFGQGSIYGDYCLWLPSNSNLQISFNEEGQIPTAQEQILKINHLGSNKYSIRSMHCNNMGLKASTTSSYVICNDIGTSNDSVPTDSQWEIQPDSTGYYIKNVSNGQYLTWYDDPLCEAPYEYYVKLQGCSEDDQVPIWTINRITTSYQGVTIKNEVDAVVVGDSQKLEAGVYSSNPNILGQNGFTWSVTNVTGSATINQDGILTAVSPGKILVRATYKYTNIFKEFTVNVIPKSGPHIIKNRQYNKFIKSGSTLKIADYDASKYQRWNFIYLDHGYFKIKSQSGSGFLTVPSGNETSSNVGLTVAQNNESDNQKWKISSTSQGYVKIKAKSSESYTTQDLVLIVDSSFNVKQGVYQNDSNYSDEWSITLLPRAYSIGGTFGNAEINEMTNAWEACGYYATFQTNPRIQDLNFDNLSSDIVFFASHGTQHHVILKNDVYLADGFSDTNQNHVDITDFNLSSVKLCVYSACLAASNEDLTGKNLCTQTIAAGAQCVIGWEEEICDPDAKDWQKTFRMKLAEGCTIEAAANYADNNPSDSLHYYNYNAIVGSRHLYGNGNIVLKIDSLLVDSSSDLYNDNDISEIELTAQSVNSIDNIDIDQLEDNTFEESALYDMDSYSVYNTAETTVNSLTECIGTSNTTTIFQTIDKKFNPWYDIKAKIPYIFRHLQI